MKAFVVLNGIGTNYPASGSWIQAQYFALADDGTLVGDANMVKVGITSTGDTGASVREALSQVIRDREDDPDMDIEFI